MHVVQEPTYDVYGRTVKIDCVLGVPGLSIPIGLASDGMPIGIMLHGRPGDSSLHTSCSAASWTLAQLLPRDTLQIESMASICSSVYYLTIQCVEVSPPACAAASWEK